MTVGFEIPSRQINLHTRYPYFRSASCRKELSIVVVKGNARKKVALLQSALKRLLTSLLPPLRLETCGTPWGIYQGMALHVYRKYFSNGMNGIVETALETMEDRLTFQSERVR